MKDGTALTDSRRRRDRARILDQPRLRIRRVAGHEDQPHRHARIPRLPGRRDRRPRRRRRRARAWSPPRPAWKSAPSACSAKRSRARDPVLFVVSMMDKEHADFDRDLPADQDAPHEQGHPDRGARRRRAPTSTASSTSSRRRRTSYKRGVKTGEYEETDIPPEVAGAVRSLLRRADRVDLGDRRHAARALPRGRRDLARRSDRAR